MNDDLTPVVMIRSHVEGTLQVLQTALGYHRSIDLAKSYESGRRNPSYSKLTIELEGQVNRIQDYLEVANEQSESESDEPA